jgi:type IV pilus assembly protein PilM
MAMPVAIGLDIGSSAVRAAEVSLDGSRPVVHRFGQVALPVGAVVDGEVADVDKVADAIKRLWTEAGFKSRSVVVGLSSQRVIVRQAELPKMSREDLTSALPFEAQELIPIPVEDALLDAAFLPDPPSPSSSAGADSGEGAEAPPTMRVLLVAAQRDMVRSHLAAVEHAGLQVEAVDLVPLAMLRAVPPAAETTGAEALVSIGHSLTHIVVRENGLPRFVRVLNTGGGDVTEALARELSVEPAQAESMKRHGAQGGVAVTERTKPVIDVRVDALVEEVRGSLDFFLAQSDVDQIDRVVVSGGGIRTPNLLQRLADELGQPVEVANVLEGFKAHKSGLSETQIDSAASLFVIPAGLAFGQLPSAPEWGRVSLLPAEVQQKRKQRRQAMVAVAAVAAFATLLAGGWLFRASSVSSAKSKAAKAEAVSASLQQQIAALHEVTETQAALKERTDSTKQVLARDVDWVRLIQQVTALMPNDVWLTGITMQQSDGKSAGTVNFSVSGASHEAVARWVRQVSTLPSLAGLWVPTEAKGSGTNGAPATVSFASTASLTDAALSNRAKAVTGDTP